MTHPVRHHTPNGFKRGLAWSAVNIILACVLLAAAILRENPIFWRNAGGFPVLLRELVLLLFYPGLVAYFIGVAGVSWMAFRLLGEGFRCGGVLFYAGMVQWVLLTVIVIIVIWNNVDNLIHGLPLHYHPAV